ncbi:MAG: phenylalanine--tRNA ligase subunit beta [Hyphomicrobiales bacterium]|nr:phenylalanine--tRNA ligase subunit beta [Hyphomicrobiales bacterium]
MKFTLSWLKDHLDTETSLAQIVDKLTMIGLEVEEVDDPSEKFAPFTVASVVSAEQHPNADRLKVCLVDAGKGLVQVVCGAPNARAGMKGVFAPVGTVLPGTGLELTAAAIRGVESNGMLCSEREMGLSDEHTGIIEIDAEAEIGTPFAKVLGLDDPVIDIAITPNRPDCLGVHGVARDLAAAGLGTLKEAPIPPVKGAYPCPTKVRLEFGDTEPLCPAFALRLVRGVNNGPSPDWMQHRLHAIGLRPINALVDITNYVTYDRGRPLHVFDFAKVKGDLTVRRAKKGESLLALDGRTYTFDPSMCVIADETGVESLSGIMGGAHSGCTAETTDVLIESALWVPDNIAETGRKLSIQSDARYRFERGVDPAFNVPGLELATRMVLELTGGEPSEVVLAGKIPDEKRSVTFDPGHVKRLGGLTLPAAKTKAILESLGFRVSGAKAHKVTVPSWRPDVQGAADLVEEVVRIFGIDKVPAAPMTRPHGVATPVLTLEQNRRRHVRRALAGRGMLEAVRWSFVAANHAKSFGGGARDLALANPISPDLAAMRPSLLPGLIMAAQRNADRGSDDVALFEVGPAYAGDRPEDQFMVASGIRRGSARMAGSGRHWAERFRPVDVFDAKADALAALAAAGAPVDSLQVSDAAPDWYHPGRSGLLQLGLKTVLAHFGELHPGVLQVLDASGPVVGFEIFLEAIPAPRARATRTRPPLDISDLHPVRRDFAFVVDEGVRAADLLRAARSADKALIAEVNLFDVFTGEAIGEGKKSLAIEVTLQPREKTLTDEEIEAVARKIVAQVNKATGGVLRT